MRKLSPLTIADRQRAEARARKPGDTSASIHVRFGINKPLHHFAHIDAFKFHTAMDSGVQIRVVPAGKHFKLPPVRHCTWG